MQSFPDGPANSSLAGRLVLVVDDSPTVLKLVTLTLERHGLRVTAAPDAMRALARLNEVVPDLLLLDINMPRIDGYQLCRLVRANAATQRVPVILLSGRDGLFDRVRGKLAGSDEYLTKPFEPRQLLAAVERHLRKPNAAQ